ncbi:MAG TPA: hypothetical protein VF282_11155 [Bacillota bacterium]
MLTLIWLLFTLAAAVWTFADAGRRHQSGFLWSAAVLLLSLPGLLIYLAVRPLFDATNSYGERLWELERTKGPR